jgi:hypothetical protein
MRSTASYATSSTSSLLKETIHGHEDYVALFNHVRQGLAGIAMRVRPRLTDCTSFGATRFTRAHFEGCCATPA